MAVLINQFDETTCLHPPSQAVISIIYQREMISAHNGTLPSLNLIRRGYIIKKTHQNTLAFKGVMNKESILTRASVI